MKEYKNPEYKYGKSKIKSFYTSNNVKSLGHPKIENSKDKKSNNFKSSESEYVVNKVSSFNTIGIFKIVFVILLIVSMARIMKNPTSSSLPSLQSLLDLLSNAPDITGDIQFFFSKLSVPNFPFPFNWVSWILNTFIDLWSVVIWFGTSTWNIFIFVGYFAIWILGV